MTFGNLLLNNTNLVNEIVPGFSPICFTIICTNGCSGLYELISDCIANLTDWQGGGKKR